MSAESDVKMGHVFVNEEALGDARLMNAICNEFEESADFDNERLEKRMQREILCRKVCIVKTVLFPLEAILNLIVLGPTDAVKHLRLQRDMVKFIFKRMSLEMMLASIITNS